MDARRVIMGLELLRWRRELARELTKLARTPASEGMSASISFGGKTRRIGITGPPGAGKSSLIAMLVKEWATGTRRVGVIAIDPTSPLSGGSLLGDRIRMDGVAQDPNVFIRSLSSGHAHDGLCPNISSLIAAFEQANFDYLIVETVGVGQVSYEVRSLVDTCVLVLMPESGDTVQAMKAGILEVADIYVVNKADRPTSAKLATELRSIAGWRANSRGWTPAVVLTSTTENRGAVELAKAIEGHHDAVLNPERVRALTAARKQYHLRSMILQHVDEILASGCVDIRDASVGETLRLILDKLCKR
jgi:LAO/AO transport system kinase